MLDSDEVEPANEDDEAEHDDDDDEVESLWRRCYV